MRLRHKLVTFCVGILHSALIKAQAPLRLVEKTHFVTGTENVEAGLGIHHFISGAVSPLVEYIGKYILPLI